MDKIKSIEVITHYDVGDDDCIGDYRDMEILINKKQVVSYGDYYHDKGHKKVQGFIDAVKYLTGFKGKTKYKNKADR